MAEQEVAIRVNDIHKEFILPQSKNTSMKQAAVNIVRKNNKVTQKVLDGVSFDVNNGDFFGIVGRNGSGKSTLLKLIAGVYHPTAGSIEINGGLTPFIELGVGFNPELSGHDNVYLNGALLGYNRKQMDDLYDEIVEFAELGPFMDQKLKNYSSGMQVRLAFSIAIKAKNDILIFDEVLAVGDQAFQQKCLDVFERYKAEGQTVIFVTHDMGAVRRFCNRAMIISKGEIEAIGHPNDIADVYTRENIDPAFEEESKKTKIKANILNQATITKDRLLKIEFKYQVNTKHYLGISLVSKGNVIAELNSKNETFESKKTHVELKLELEQLNPGTYEIGVAIFDVSTGALIDFNNNVGVFLLEGADINRGGALKLFGSWS